MTIQNIGSRPATNALVDIRVSGDFSLTAPTTELRSFGLIPVMERPVPPSQPQPPPSLSAILNNINQFNNLALPDLDFTQHLRDQEDFDYAADVKLETESSIGLVCGLWRHSLEPKEFTVRMVPKTTESPITGEVSCTVHADNLTMPAMFKLVVTLSPDSQPALVPALRWFTTPHPHEPRG